MPHGHICPPVPGRHADALREVVDTVDGAALVAAGNHQIPIHHIDEVRLPLALHLPHINLLLLYILVDKAALADGAGDDVRCKREDVRCKSFYFARRTCHFAYIICQVLCRPEHALPVVFIHHNRCCLTILSNAESITLCSGRQGHQCHQDTCHHLFHITLLLLSYHS